MIFHQFFPTWTCGGWMEYCVHNRTNMSCNCLWIMQPLIQLIPSFSVRKLHLLGYVRVPDDFPLVLYNKYIHIFDHLCCHLDTDVLPYALVLLQIFVHLMGPAYDFGDGKYLKLRLILFRRRKHKLAGAKKAISGLTAVSMFSLACSFL